MKHRQLEILGWCGTGAILLAYALLSFNKLQSGDLAFQLLNLAGGITVAADSFYHRSIPGASLNIVWSLIAFVIIIKIIF